MNLLWRLLYRVAYRLLLVYWFFVRPRCEGVHAAVWCKGRLLLVRDSYRRYCTMPAGLARKNEDLAAAAARELQEEAGIEVPPDDLRRVFETVARHEFKSDHSVIFEVELESEPATRVDHREIVWADFVEPRADGSLPLSPIVVEFLRWRESRGAG